MRRLGSPRARAALLYVGIRLVLLVLALGVGILAGLRGVVLVAVAFVVSGLVSYPLARRQREDLAAQWGRRR
ncbi:MAG: DUF4229 domain-containing protein [Mycobacteriales bacterium]